MMNIEKTKLLNTIRSSKLNYQDLIELVNQAFNYPSKDCNCNFCGAVAEKVFYGSHKIYIVTCTSCPFNCLEFNFMIRAKKQKKYSGNQDYGLYIRGDREGIKDYIHFVSKLYSTMELRAGDLAYIRIPFFNSKQNNFKKNIEKKAISDFIKRIEIIENSIAEFNLKNIVPFEYSLALVGGDFNPFQLVSKNYDHTDDGVFELRQKVLDLNDRISNIEKNDEEFILSYINQEDEHTLFALNLCTIKNETIGIEYEVNTKRICQSNILDICRASTTNN